MAAPELPIAEMTIKQVAAMAATGASRNEIADQLKISRYTASKIMTLPLFKIVVKEIGDEAVSNAKQIIRSKTGFLAQKIMEVLTARLEKDDLEAVKVALKIMGFDQSDAPKGDTTFTIQLPGVQNATGKTVEHTIEPEFSVIEEAGKDAKPPSTGDRH